MNERFKNFTVLISKIGRGIRKIKTEEMSEFDLKSPHVSCLYYLHVMGDMSATKLCEVCAEDKAAISRTIEYLKKGGRISAAVAIAGKILSIKPVVGIVDGEVKMLGKAMGLKNASNLLNKIVNEKGLDFSMPYCVLYSGLEKATLDKYIKDSANIWEGETDEIPEYVLGATIGTHVGPGAIGVAFFAK